VKYVQLHELLSQIPITKAFRAEAHFLWQLLGSERSFFMGVETEYRPTIVQVPENVSQESVRVLPFAWPTYDAAQDHEFLSPERTIFQRPNIVTDTYLTKEIEKPSIFPYERWPGYVEQRARELIEASRSVAKTIVSSSYDPQRIIAAVMKAREEFYREVPEARPKEQTKRRAYDIAFDVSRYRELIKKIVDLPPEEGEKEIANFDTNLHRALLTHLKENCYVHDHTTLFHLADEKMVMRELSNQPFEEVVALGVALIEKDDGHIFPIREYEELKTVIAVGELLQFAPIGTRYLLISGPGEKYPLNYVDFGEVKETETGEKYLEVVRFKSSASYDKYHNVSLLLDSLHFDGYDPQKMHISAWHLGHIISLPESALTSHQLYEQYIGRDPEAMDERVFQNEVYRVCEKYVYRYEDAIRQQASWREIRDAYVQMVAAQQDAVDQLREHRQRGTVVIDSDEQREDRYEAPKRLLVQDRGDDFYRERGVQTSKSGCGDVDGYGSGEERMLEMADGRIYAENHFFGERVVQRALGVTVSTNEDDYEISDKYKGICVNRDCPVRTRIYDMKTKKFIEIKPEQKRGPCGLCWTCDAAKGGIASKKWQKIAA